MTRSLSRKGFIKTASIGASALAVLTGCGPASRYVTREPYTRMPEYTYNGESTYFATTCRECPAGCGIVVRTEQGRALKVEGNPNHPVSMGKTCSRGQAAMQGLYNPDRVQRPSKLTPRGNTDLSEISWEDAIKLVQDALQTNQPSQVAFLLGMAPDHLFDLVTELCIAIGAPPPLRYGAHEIFDARNTLQKAAQQLYSANTLPYFDIAHADVVFSFGANYLETYLSPIAQARGFAQMRRGSTGKRGYTVQFEARLSQTAAASDEWIPIRPGSEGLVALAIGQLVSQARGGNTPNAYENLDLDSISKTSDVPMDVLMRLAKVFSDAEHPLAIPGGSTLGASNGLEAASAVLALNAVVKNIGSPGGVFTSPPTLIKTESAQQPNSIVEMSDLIGRMQRGEIKTLFIHGVNPVFELPSSMGFSDALANVPQVISFASFLDETSASADYILPDHTGLESWGYQKAPVADRVVISGFQPVVVPFYNTMATADIFLAAAQTIGGDLASALPHKDEVEYIQDALNDLITQEGYFNAPEIKSFMALFQQYGGWWTAQQDLASPDTSNALNQIASVNPASFDGTGEYFLFPFMSPILGDGSGANKPWLQETPDPTTTVMWNSWVEINPKTADDLLLENDDVVKITSSTGEIEAIVYRYPGIRPDTIAIPFGQGHTVYGRYASGRGVNPARLFGLLYNGADDLAYASTRVKIEKTGRKQKLSRLESVMGVYREGLGE